MDRQHFVQQYVERQRAYVPTYTTGDIANAYQTPSKQPRSDLEFGFDTPVLRPRVQPATLANKGSPSDKALDHAKEKRKKGSAPVDTDNERAARLADRRERKRKKRAIVSPPEEDDQENVRTARPRKGKANKPAALALMYGFSATNVTKDRLTLKPAPFLGVFGKGKASTKKKVTATKKSSSRNELFSESAFLNKPSERTDAPSEIDDDSDNDSTHNHSVPRETRLPNRAKKDRGKGVKMPSLKKASGATSRTTVGSEIWDIEMQSKLPSSACDVSSVPGMNEFAPVVLDLRGAGWSIEKRRDKTSSLSLVPSGPRIESIMICSPPPAGSDLGDGLLAPHAADASSLHPSHSASQVGHREVGTRAADRRVTISKYFAEPKPAFDQGFVPNPGLIMESDHEMDMVSVEDQDVKDAEPDVQTIHRAANPMSPPTDVPAFRIRYDMVQDNDCPCEDCWRGANVPSELVGGSDLGYFVESAVVGAQDEGFVIEECDAWDWDAGEYGPSAPEYDVEEAEPAGEPWTETDMDESVCWDEEVGGDFLEGRALLRGVEDAPRVGLPGLDEVERDVASRLRYHWRPLRL